LQRFVDAQQPVYDQVCRELRDGRKRSHWMWFIFPQLAGLGHSPTAQYFGIANPAHAAAYLAHHCDTLLILGSTMPWIDSYPKPGAARGVQVDLKADRIGLRYPIDVGLVGDSRQTLTALLPMLTAKQDRSFLMEAQSQLRDWNTLLQRIESTARSPCGADGFRCNKPEEVRSAILSTLRSPRPALLEALVDANEPPLKPDQLQG
jgi:thiamine pyrophosphate-dependent acetolactate synthase large subunit-like protein